MSVNPSEKETLSIIGKAASKNGNERLRHPSDVDVNLPSVVITKESKSGFVKQSPEKIVGNGNLQLNVEQHGPVKTALSVSRRSSVASSIMTSWRVATTAVIASNALQDTKKEVVRKMRDSSANIPVLPLPLAVGFLVCNCLVPGLGTILSGFTFFCVATTLDQEDRELVKPKAPGMMCTNLLIGTAQLFTVTFLLVGWFWSISWGLTMVYLALDHNDRSSRPTNLKRLPP
ncbi:uncharacterized protein LOC143461580 [Clavelina lepadiformis]|uniref:Protein SPEC3 n=1 Tax=Clavelina lepadiformis TaxID=159417 RepID=A0ABP0GLC7_CLALP